MEFLQPESLDDALSLRAAHPDALPLMGGTDVMVELNFDKHRPTSLLDLGRVTSLTDVTSSTLADGRPAVSIGAGVTWTSIITEHGADLSGLAIAARTVGSPQIRNRGTLGGSLGSASPAGDGLPLLVASGSEIEVASAARGTRRIAARDWLVRPRTTAAEPDELIVAIHTPAASSPAVAQQFAKIGTRNAMVIAVASFAIHVDRDARTIGTGIGSAGPTVLAATDAAQLLADHITEIDGWASPAPIDPAVVERFGELAAGAARPIDDVRGTASYRVHSVGVMARRTFTWCWNDICTAHATATARS